MRLRRPCEHDRYDEHATKDGKYWSQVKMLQAHKYPAAFFTVCPGGEFLPEDALVIERIEGEWPWSVLETVWVHSGGSAEGLLRGFDALAVQVGEPG